LDEPSYVKCKNIHNIEKDRLHEKVGTMEDGLIDILYKIIEYNS